MKDAWRPWYDNLNKPEWTPEGSTIGLIWACLYPIILISFAVVVVQAFRGKLSWWVVLPFVVNLIANLAFSPIQFGMQNLRLASLDIAIVWGSIIWMVIAIWPYMKWVAFAQIPYFIWVSLASYLQYYMTWMNRS